MQSLDNKQVIEKLKVQFETFYFFLEFVEIINSISVFIIKVNTSETEFENKWKSITKEIAFGYQTKIETEFLKWNMYIIFVCEENISKDLKYKIENNKFSCRKILEDNFSGNLNSEDVRKALIEKHITNTDLILDSVREYKEAENYIPKTKIWSIVDAAESLKGDKKKQGTLLVQVTKFIENEN